MGTPSTGSLTSVGLLSPTATPSAPVQAEVLSGTSSTGSVQGLLTGLVGTSGVVDGTSTVPNLVGTVNSTLAGTSSLLGVAPVLPGGTADARPLLGLTLGNTQILGNGQTPVLANLSTLSPAVTASGSPINANLLTGANAPPGTAGLVGNVTGAVNGATGGLLTGVTGTNGLVPGAVTTVNGVLNGALGGVTGGTGPLAGITGTVTGLTGGLTGGGAGPLSGVTSAVSGLTGGLTGGGTAPLSGVTGAVSGLTGGLTGGANPVTGLVGGVTTTVGNVVGGVTGGATGGTTPVSGVLTTVTGLTGGLTGRLTGR